MNIYYLILFTLVTIGAVEFFTNYTIERVVEDPEPAELPDEAVVIEADTVRELIEALRNEPPSNPVKNLWIVPKEID